MTWKKWVGVGLIGLSGVWFAMLIVVPFTLLALWLKALLEVVFLVLMEVFFWLGTLIVGKQAVSHFWARLKSRRGKRQDASQNIKK